MPLGDCLLKLSFPSIRRIADVAWYSEKIVFEIQYSPISAEEVLARTRDYRSLGWEVVWILHDHRYNQIRLSAAENALRSSPHFFTNFNRFGEGIIYDQFDLCDHSFRLHRLPPLPVAAVQMVRNLKSPVKMNYPLRKLEDRVRYWPLSFEGDLLSQFSNGLNEEYFLKAAAMEKEFYGDADPSSWLSILRKLPTLFWKKCVVRPYQIVFRFFLERMCR